MALRLRLAVSQPKLLSTISIMSENIEAPLSQTELASEIGLSTRQLERLFLKYLSCTPSRYYLEMRLNRARALLQQTCMSVTNVALATGSCPRRISPSPIVCTSATRRGRRSV